MNDIWKNLEKCEKILILGFGREGKSTYKFIRAHDKDRTLAIGDENPAIKNDPIFADDIHIECVTGENYLKHFSDYDCIIKTPGISLPDTLLENLKGKLTSQADLFLKAYKNQTVGITGTKGKSTTSAFIAHVLQTAGKDALLLGNIGIPPLDCISKIHSETIIIYELSSHMLQAVSTSPHIAILLNIFPEHLDYYKTLDHYISAKANIFKYQNENDILIVCDDRLARETVEKFGTTAEVIMENSIPENIKTMFQNPSSDVSIKGAHLLKNMMFGVYAASRTGANPETFAEALKTFHGLPHRLETIGTWKNITFINDSIATIPEAAIATLETFPKTNILILGGMDRGISYDILINEILSKSELFVFCIDEIGKRIHDALISKNPNSKKYFLFENLEEAVKQSYKTLSVSGGTVLLSPAAASYTQFKNFEERGQAFANYAREYGIS